MISTALGTSAILARFCAYDNRKHACSASARADARAILERHALHRSTATALTAA
jgi:hypothetical protein